MVLNPNGRPKGSKSLVSTKEIRRQIGDFINDKAFPELFKNFEKMTHKNQIELVTKLLPYFTPSLSASKIESELTENRNISVNISYGKDKPSIDPGDEHKEDQSDIDDADFTDVE